MQNSIQGLSVEYQQTTPSGNCGMEPGEGGCMVMSTPADADFDTWTDPEMAKAYARRLLDEGTTTAASTTIADLHLAAAMLSDRGRLRQTNQDACGARADRAAYVVCDGMGGAAGGEIASRMAVETFLAGFTTVPPSAGERTRAALGAAIRAANAAVFREASRRQELQGMGTTLVALVFAPAHATGEGATAWLGHVGDSRCYRWRAGELTQLTEDHSLVEEQVRAGRLSRLEAGTSPMRNIITRAVGSQATVQATIAMHSVERGDLYLLASDGLTRELEHAAIAAALECGDALDAICRNLVDAANAAGGRDNVTVLAVRVG